MDKDYVKSLEKEIESLKEKERMLLQAQEISGLGIWQYDMLKNQVTWSQEVYRIYEMDPATDKPKIEDIFHYSSSEEKTEIKTIINKAVASGGSYNVDCSIITKNGQKRFVNAIGQSYIKNGLPVFLFGTITDITERKSREQKLRFSDFTIESISDAIYWIDDQAKFFRINNGVEAQLGYCKDEIVGLSGKDINPEFTKSKSQKYWGKARESGVFTFETSHTRKDGTVFPVEITNNIMMFDGKEFRVSIVRDITERKQRENEVLDALAEVEKLKNQLQEENIYLREEIKLQNNFDQIITSCSKFKKILKEIEMVAETEATVLITGESGTGKELLSRAIHNLSKKSTRPMVKVNCAALPENLIESELFGHEKGAFTGATEKKIGRFELANDTTLFLDEIGELPIDLQAKMLRVLQEGEFERLGSSKTLKSNARIIAATNRNLEEEVQGGNFREDLFYRLNVFPIHSIPLRERKEDIPLLVKHFIDLHSKKNGRNIQNITKKAMEALLSYQWPGNIRELENLIERAVVITSGKVIKFGNWLPKNNLMKNVRNQTLEEIEKKHIKDTLRLTKGKISGKDGAAKLLGLNANTLYSRLKKHNLIPKKVIDI